MKKFWFVLLGILVVVYGCSPSVGRKVIRNGELEIEGILGGAFFKYTFIPLPLPNLGVGVRYGVTDDFNVGIKVFPIYALFNTVQVVPYGVFRLYESHHQLLPSINLYSELNSLIYFSPIQGVSYPLIGGAPIWRFKWGSVYLPCEVSFDFYNDRKPFKFNLGLGMNSLLFTHFEVSIEVRVNSIGNIYLPLGSMVGVPVLVVSGSYRF